MSAGHGHRHGGCRANQADAAQIAPHESFSNIAHHFLLALLRDVFSLTLLFLVSMGSCRKDHKKYAITEPMTAKEWEGHECKGDCPGKQETGAADPLSSLETRLRAET